ncbi:prolyl-tRNA synthetase [Sinobaca qinghaiensis]|uniref:Proline--tRNA ligase n=1 Tax=Sinobaca qinghaiensis TaxID=342944 RepID=A0A419V5S6_9BACL|nr:proline--tRNA ligase [Sinobaca qinghaiensis]RKD75342.1 prolyl-tRNA synthetase [Sinobaca qinghaiensis]
MRQQSFFSPTMRDVPQGADITSHQLMLRAGLIRQTASGIYSYLPLGYKVLRKIENIVREEMNNAGAQEILMPAVQPAEIWEESGRIHDYGPELMRLKDRHNRDFVLGATHEEVITSLVRDELNSYKKLPVNLYQIQNKYRDERRPRFGVLRSREFVMKDAYSFDSSEEGLEESYWNMFRAYQSVFKRCGLDFRAVEADAGAIGGKGGTHEFMALSDVGEDTIAYSDASDFAANIEVAKIADGYEKPARPETSMAPIDTPSMKTIDDLMKGLSIESTSIIKSVLFIADEEPVLVLVRGDHEVNEIKVANLLDSSEVRLAEDAEVEQVMGCRTGFIGPVRAPENVKILADYAVRGIAEAVTGANESDKHFINVHPDRDITISSYEDLRFIKEGDPAPDGKGTIRFAKGIEVGQVFKLGTKYSKALKADFLDEQGKAQPLIMGCYGIGVSRTIAAIVEQHHDESGIIWPKNVAPFDIHLLTMNVKQEDQAALGESLYKKLREAGFDVLYDDRKERAGVKFKDADLYGIPVRVACGKKAAEDIVEVKLREGGEAVEVAVSGLMDYLKQHA